MNTTYLIFDYFKEAFRLNIANKTLYKPQIILIIIKTLMFLVLGFIGLDWIKNGMANINTIGYFENIDKLFMLILILLTFFLAYIILSGIVEAGLYNMYKSCILYDSVKQGDFSRGVSKYFFKFLLGDILILIFWVLALIPYLILGLITLTIAFSLIPLIVNIFLTMWKVSLVMKDLGVIDAFKDSFRFAKVNFLPLTVLQMIHWSFTSTISGGNSNTVSKTQNILEKVNEFKEKGNMRLPIEPEMLPSPSDGGEIFNSLNSANMTSIASSTNVNTLEGYPISGAEDNMDVILDKVINIGAAIIIPVISIIIAIGALIKMLFDVFFSLALFVAYKGEFKQVQPEEEVLV